MPALRRLPQRSHLFVERSAPKRVLCLAALYLRSGIGLSGLVEIPVGQNAQGPTALSSRMHRHRHYLHVIGWKGSKIPQIGVVRAQGAFTWRRTWHGVRRQRPDHSVVPSAVRDQCARVPTSVQLPNESIRMTRCRMLGRPLVSCKLLFGPGFLSGSSHQADPVPSPTCMVTSYGAPPTPPHVDRW